MMMVTRAYLQYYFYFFLFYKIITPDTNFNNGIRMKYFDHFFFHSKNRLPINNETVSLSPRYILSVSQMERLKISNENIFRPHIAKQLKQFFEINDILLEQASIENGKLLQSISVNSILLNFGISVE